MNYQEITGNLITLAKEGKFDVIAHGCNCFCKMARGIAPQMATTFGCDKFPMEGGKWKETSGLVGNINKLGQIDFQSFYEGDDGRFCETINKIPLGFLPGVIGFTVVNMYTQYDWRGEKPFDYEAADLCLRKVNHIFKGKHIGLPQVGCGLAGGDWDVVKRMIQRRLKDMDITIVMYDNT
jgi:O-acetyl-ADP-ribose deacetylase (regulator of RNase III)